MLPIPAVLRLLAGIGSDLMLAAFACVFLFQVLLSLLQFLAPEALQQIVFWLSRRLLRATLPKVGIVSLVLAVVLPLLLADAWRLTALRLGDERARALGVEVGPLRPRAFVAVTLLTGPARCWRSWASTAPAGRCCCGRWPGCRRMTAASPGTAARHRPAAPATCRRTPAPAWR